MGARRRSGRLTSTSLWRGGQAWGPRRRGKIPATWPRALGGQRQKRPVSRRGRGRGRTGHAAAPRARKTRMATRAGPRGGAGAQARAGEPRLRATRGLGWERGKAGLGLCGTRRRERAGSVGRGGRRPRGGCAGHQRARGRCSTRKGSHRVASGCSAPYAKCTQPDSRRGQGQHLARTREDRPAGGDRHRAQGEGMLRAWAPSSAVLGAAREPLWGPTVWKDALRTHGHRPAERTGPLRTEGDGGQCL